MRELALQRGIAVKEYLAGQKLPLDRLFLGSAKPGPMVKDWAPRAELTLANNRAARPAWWQAYQGVQEVLGRSA